MYKITAQIIFSFQKLITYFKLFLTVSKHKTVVLALLSDLDDNNNSSNNEEKNSMFILQLKKCKIQSTNLLFTSIRNKVGNQDYNL